MSQVSQIAQALCASRAGLAVAMVAGRLREKRWFAALQRALPQAWSIAIVGYLAYCLAGLGWTQIRQWMPAFGPFYLLLLVPYFLQPLADMVIYRRLWQPQNPLGPRVFLRKRFMNSLFDYSGEVYLFVWGKRNLALPESFLLHSIRDNNLMSAAVPMTVLLVLFTGLTMTGQWRLPMRFGEDHWGIVIMACLPLLMCMGLLFARRRLTTLGGKRLLFAFSIHSTRGLTTHAVEVALWTLAMPAVPLVAWLNFLAVRILISRLSFVPNKDLVFLTAGIGMAGVMDLPQAGVAAVLLSVAATDLLLNLLFLGLPSLAASSRQPALARVRD